MVDKTHGQVSRGVRRSSADATSVRLDECRIAGGLGKKRREAKCESQR